MKLQLAIALFLAGCSGERTKTPTALPGDGEPPGRAPDAATGGMAGVGAILPEPPEGGADPVVACEEPTPELAPIEPRDWPETKGWARVDALVFRVGCLARSPLENHLRARERQIVECFAERDDDVRTTVVLRTEWLGASYKSELARAELRAPGTTAEPLRGCLERILASFQWRGLEEEQRTVVDIEMTRGFFPEGGGTGKGPP